MLMTLPLVAALCATPGQAAGPTLTDARVTHGVLGPTRDGTKFLPGDTLFLTFTIDGVTADPDGKVRYSIATEVSDAGGKSVFRQPAQDRETINALGGGQMPAFAQLAIGQQMPAGQYALTVTVADGTTKKSQSLTQKFEVLKPDFGLVRLSTSADADGQVPAALLCAGQSLWVHGAVVGFQRGAGQQPNVTLELTVRDADGKPTLSKPFGGTINKDVPAKDVSLPVQFLVSLNRPGKFTVEVKATDQLSGKTATQSFPITVSVVKYAGPHCEVLMRDTFPGPRPRLMIWLALPLLALPARAADKPAAPERRAPAATCVTETASLLRREAPDKPWQIVKEGEEVFTGDQLMGGAGGALDTRDGAVRLVVVGDVDGLSPIPILETAFVLHEASGTDLDFTFERGRVRLINLKKEGPAHVRLRVRKIEYEFTLVDPGTTLSLELFSRWPRGVPFHKTPVAGEEPALVWAVVAVKGQVELKGPRRSLTLQAPPGPALLMGDSLGNPEPAVESLKELPAWCPERLADLGHTERGRKALALAAHWRKEAAEKGVAEATAECLHSDDPFQRHLAVMWLAATDNMEQLGEVLRSTKHQDVWEAGIVALRNWIGRDAGQDQKLYQGLVEKVKLAPAEAAGVLDLLHTFGPEDLARPETYHVLINYLGSERVSLRELAHWHLRRLVPGGDKINYDPLGPKEQRDAAIKEWRTLVPAGQAPAKRGGE